MAHAVDAEMCRMNAEMSAFQSEKLDRLKNLDFFILDNSIRETAVGQIRAHTLEDKIAILHEVRKCNVKDIIVASFSHTTHVDDDFCQNLFDSNEDFTNFYSFSEVSEGGIVADGRYETKKTPIASLKNKKYGIRNTIFEVDLADPNCKWGDVWSVHDHCQMLLARFRWVRSEIHRDARILVNFRDFTEVMSTEPKRLLEVVHFIASLPLNERIFGFQYEDLGEALPEELALWVKSIRNVMTACGWSDGLILAHVHQKWDLHMASTLSCLSSGADGIWASMCQEGGVLGHACSSVTVMNLVRLGNTKVLQKYDCVKMRSAARKVTRISTGRESNPMQVLYGDHALDIVFDGLPPPKFDAVKFFGLNPIYRMSIYASPEMIRARLVTLFGEDESFTLTIARQMKARMIEDARLGRKEEYMSHTGLALLFRQAGGKQTERMSSVLTAEEQHLEDHDKLDQAVLECFSSVCL